MWADLGDPSGMGSGQPPPKVIATQRSGIWGVVGTFFGRCLLRDVRPEGHVPKKNRRRRHRAQPHVHTMGISLPTIAVPEKSPRAHYGKFPRQKQRGFAFFHILGGVVFGRFCGQG